jgi:hypothetical protein
MMDESERAALTAGEVAKVLAVCVLAVAIALGIVAVLAQVLPPRVLP